MKYYNYPDPRGTEVAEDVDSKNISEIAPNELPDIGNSDAGKVLTVNSSHNGTEWKAVPTELPPITSADGGKVCKVKSDHSGVEWGEDIGGAFIVNLTAGDDDTLIADKTAKEIFDASCVGPVIGIASEGGQTFSSSVGAMMTTLEGGYEMGLIQTKGILTLVAVSDDATSWTAPEF